MSSSPERTDSGQQPDGQDDDLRSGDWVTCFFSGRQVLRHQALKIRLGPGQRVWMDAELTRSG